MADSTILNLATALTLASAVDTTAMYAETVAPADVKVTLAILRQIMRNGLVEVAGTDAAVSMVAGAFYKCDLNAVFSASRIYTLPASPAVGTRVGVQVIVGHATRYVAIVGNTGQTINGGTAATEWSRLFNVGEYAIFECVATDTWIVQDGRIPMVGLMELTTPATGEAAATNVLPTSQSGVWTSRVDTGGIVTVGTSLMTVRRRSYGMVSAGAGFTNAGTAGQYGSIRIVINGVTTAIAQQRLGLVTGTTQVNPNVTKTYFFAAGDTLQYQYATEAGAIGLAASVLTHFGFTEVLRAVGA